MGVNYALFCETCKAVAPSLGDSGTIGYPTAADVRPESMFDMPTFGYVYSGLAAVALLTKELDDFLSFLMQHRGHRLVQAADGDAESDGWESKGADAPIPEQSPKGSERYVHARYRASCLTCGEDISSQATDVMREFERRTVSEKSISRFLKRVKLDLEIFYRAEPLSPKDLRSIRRFFKKHAAHAVEVSLVPVQ